MSSLFFSTTVGADGPGGGPPPGAVAVSPPMTGSSTSICCVIGRGGSLTGIATLNFGAAGFCVSIPGPPGAGPIGGPGAAATRFPGVFNLSLDTRAGGCCTVLATFTGRCNVFFKFLMILFTNGVPLKPYFPV